MSREGHLILNVSRYNGRYWSRVEGSDVDRVWGSDPDRFLLYPSHDAAKAAIGEHGLQGCVVSKVVTERVAEVGKPVFETCFLLEVRGSSIRSIIDRFQEIKDAVRANGHSGPGWTIGAE